MMLFDDDDADCWDVGNCCLNCFGFERSNRFYQFVKALRFCGFVLKMVFVVNDDFC